MNHHLKSILVPGAVGAGVGGLFGASYSDNGYRGMGRWDQPKEYTVKDRLRHAGVGALLGGGYGGLMGHLGYGISKSLNPTPSGPKKVKKTPALDRAKKKWGGKPVVLNGEKLAMFLPGFFDETEKIASSLSYEEVSALLKQAGLLAQAGQWLQQNAKPMAQRTGGAIKREAGHLQAHIGEAMASGYGAPPSPLLPIHGVGQFAEGAGKYLASKVPQGPKGILRKGVGWGVGNGLEALVNPAGSVVKLLR